MLSGDIHMKYQDQWLTCYFFFVFLLSSSCLFADEKSSLAVTQTAENSNANHWQYEITPYLFGAGLDGKVGVSTRIGDVTADVDASFSDILENLDSGFMALFEARKGKWMYVFEGVYFKLKDERASSWQGPLGNTNTGSLDATVTEQIYQLTVGYRALDDRTKVDVLGAARYTQLDVDLNLAFTTGADLLPDGSRGTSKTQSWWDPVIGVRVLRPFAEAWTFVGYADIGGFGVGSDLTYQLLAGVNWQFANRWTAKAGYRHLYQDYDDNGFIWGMTSSGLYLGAGFRF
jgi:opacity protein-like surface antigen